MNVAPLPPWSSRRGPCPVQQVCPLPLYGWCGPGHGDPSGDQMLTSKAVSSMPLRKWTSIWFWPRRCKDKSPRRLFRQGFLVSKEQLESPTPNCYKRWIPHICWWTPVKVLLNPLFWEPAGWQRCFRKCIYIYRALDPVSSGGRNNAELRLVQVQTWLMTCRTVTLLLSLTGRKGKTAPLYCSLAC